MELVLGCGQKRLKSVLTAGSAEYSEPVFLDINPDHKPDIVHDLNARYLPFKDDTFEEIHAYEVLEHLGKQGDYKRFFEEFSEYHRVLKPDGLFVASVPMWNSMWAWGDPSHTRVITPGTLSFLSQAEYTKQVGKTAMSDFRYIYKADFELVGAEDRDGTFFFVLKALK